MNSSLNSSSLRLVALGLIILLSSLVGLGAMWYTSTLNNKTKVDEIVIGQNKIQLISAMRDAVQKRILSLSRMISLEDPFDIDEEYTRFMSYAGQFINARDTLFDSYIETQTERAIWDSVLNSVKESSTASVEVAQLTLSFQLKVANKKFLKTVIPLQDKVISLFNEQLSGVAASNNNKIMELSSINRNSHDAATVLISILVIFGVVTTILIISRTKKHQQSIIRYAEKVRSLYELSSLRGVSAEDQLNKMLELGCHLLEMDSGKICSINKANFKTDVINQYSVLESLGFDSESMLEREFYNRGFSSTGSVFAVRNIEHAKYNNRIENNGYKIGSIIMARVYLNGQAYGLVSFTRRFPKDQEFSDTDKEIMKLIANWISFAFDNKQMKDELQQTKAEAEHANSLKSIFLANMSHELRTPLNAIIGYSELLKEDFCDTENVSAVEDVSKIEFSGKHLLALINEILDLSKVESGKMELECDYVYLSDILSAVDTSIRPLLLKNNNTLSVKMPESDIILCVDQIRLKQVLINLMSNAGKFTKNGCIDLTLKEILIDNKQWINISITDTGIGMTEQQIKRIFKPFSQAEGSVEHTFGGTGLGLTICKKICELMGGNINVKSTFGQGTTFFINIPTNVISQTGLMHSEAG